MVARYLFPFSVAAPRLIGPDARPSPGKLSLIILMASEARARGWRGAKALPTTSSRSRLKYSARFSDKARPPRLRPKVLPNDLIFNTAFFPDSFFGPDSHSLPHPPRRQPRPSSPRRKALEAVARRCAEGADRGNYVPCR